MYYVVEIKCNMLFYRIIIIVSIMSRESRLTVLELNFAETN